MTVDNGKSESLASRCRHRVGTTAQKATNSEPVTILVDTREQRPLSFGAAPIRVATLATGDYSIEGGVDLVAIERKSLSDLFACIAGQRNRFERELERLAVLRYGALVIEATLADVLAGCPQSRVHPASAFGSLMSWNVKGRLPIFFCGDRRQAALTVAKLLEKCAKHVVASEALEADHEEA
jgi:ERCC4-type nuclease